MDPSEIRLPEVRDLTPAEKADLDAMNDELGWLFYGEEWPEARERFRRLNGGRG